MSNRASFPFSCPWPLGINPEMDAHAAERGLGNWSCVNPRSNAWWVRRDGLAYEPRFDREGGYVTELQEIDRNVGCGSDMKCLLPQHSASCAPIPWALDAVAREDSVVAAVLMTGGDAERCVVALVEQKRALLKRVMELEAIAPRKIRVGEDTFIYRCPDHFVPER